MPATLQACLEPTRHAPDPVGMFVSRVVDKVCACNLGRKNTYSYFPIRQRRPPQSESVPGMLGGEKMCLPL